MSQYSTIYTLYFEKKFGNDQREIPRIAIRRIGDSAGFEDKDITSLAKQFVVKGWKISSQDRVQTVTPVIINEWAPKPWDEKSGIVELTGNGKIVRYRGFSSEEMDSFYNTYLTEIKKYP